MDNTLDLVEVLKANKIYINTQNLGNNFFENSDTYKRYGKIPLKGIKTKNKSYEHFMQLTYDKSLAHITKGALNVKREKIFHNETNNDYFYYYKVLNTEANTDINGYFNANTMLFVSAFLKESYGIDATILKEISYELKSENEEDLFYIIDNSLILIVTCFINFFGYVIFLGGLMSEKIKEKRTNIKHLLYLSGNNIYSYWLGFYITDYIKLIIFTILLIIPIYTVSGVATYFGEDMLIINISSLSFIYFISSFCSKETEGTKILFIFVVAFVIMIALFLLILSEYYETLLDLTKAYTITIFDITPVTSMVNSFVRLILSYTFIKEMEYNSYTDEEINDILEENELLKRPEKVLVTSYIAQLINIIFYSLLLILIESGLLGKLSFFCKKKFYFEKDLNKVEIIPINNNSEKNNIDNDNSKSNIININKISDINNNNNKNKFNFGFKKENIPENPFENPYVQREIKKVNNKQEELSTFIINITKTFYPCCGCCRKGKIRAINHLHLGLEPNEKFGLLGFNGSGKTTTFRIITNELIADAGSMNIFGYDNKKQFNNIRKIIGYCPQINPLFDFMKVKEILEFYSKLKNHKETPENISKKFGLNKYLNTYTINLSGGNKRKLTFAIAMMNKPSLLLSDEPSTGVDLESRRIMWKNINELSKSGHKFNMILTTHSMEEAEILCDTISWFKAGNFLTLGNPEKLKLKYSAGYKLHIKFNEEEINRLNNELNNMEEKLNCLNSNITGFNEYLDFFRNNNEYEPYLKALINFIDKIIDKIKNISLCFIGQDYSFELTVQIINKKKKELFCDILNMKKNEKIIDELTITMQSLENILTSI